MDDARRWDGSDDEPRALLRVESDLHGDELVLSLSGDLDLSTAADLGAAMARGVDLGARTIELDLAGVGFMDSSGIAVVLERWGEVDNHPVRVFVLNASPVVERVLRVTGVWDLFDGRR